MHTLTVFYITNRPEVARIADKYGVNRIWIDLESLGKESRQKGLNTVKSKHSIKDIYSVKPVLSRAEMLVRINPWNKDSVCEIEEVLNAGADIIMLPYWKTPAEVKKFTETVNGRCRTTLLLETKEAVSCIDDVLNYGGFDEIHIGLNDLHLSYGMSFMFELLADGTVERLCKKFKSAGIPYGFGGIAKLGDGLLPAEKIIIEHYRLGSSRAILSRSFCDSTKIDNIKEIDTVFQKNMGNLRDFEMRMPDMTADDFMRNKADIVQTVNKIVGSLKGQPVLREKQRAKVLTTTILNGMSERFGSSFYILDTDVFQQNYTEISKAFKTYYKKFNIAYSYKTNYTPRLVQIVDSMGGYAEIVSDMELEIAIRSGVNPQRIIWNGPIKNRQKVKELLLQGGTVNIDSIYEIDNIKGIAEDHPSTMLNIGVRVNYDVGDGVLSRFGFDVDGTEFKAVLEFLASTPNINFVSLQAHFANRSPRFWTKRVEGMLKTYDRVVNEYGLKPKYLDLGGGIYGRMPENLRAQLGVEATTFDDYAIRVAEAFDKHFSDKEDPPWLFIEPGTAIAGDCMRFVSRIETIKTVRKKTIAATGGSQKNISMSGINPPMTIIPGNGHRQEVIDCDIVGFTCIEGDVLQKGYTGLLGVGDYIVIDNCGSYSLVMKPPFILPNFPVLDITDDNVKVVKRAETFDDLFNTFVFQ